MILFFHNFFFSLFREGVVTEKTSGEGSLVNVGLRSEVLIDRNLKAGIRVTVQMDSNSVGRLPAGSSTSHRYARGIPVSPNTPRERFGLYWGYQTRVARSLGEVFSSCPFFSSDGGYDLFLGHSEENGSTALIEAEGDPHDPAFVPFTLPPFRHMLIVIGGCSGLEAVVDADERIATSGRDADTLFDFYIRLQSEIGSMRGSKTLRIEESMSMLLTKLSPYIARNAISPHKSS